MARLHKRLTKGTRRQIGQLKILVVIEKKLRLFRDNIVTTRERTESEAKQQQTSCESQWMFNKQAMELIQGECQGKDPLGVPAI